MKWIRYSSILLLALPLIYAYKGYSPHSRTSDAEVSIRLPEGFSSTTVVKDLGRARHIALSRNGDVFVKLERLKEGKGIYRLHDSNGDGIADAYHKANRSKRQSHGDSALSVSASEPVSACRVPASPIHRCGPQLGRPQGARQCPVPNICR